VKRFLPGGKTTQTEQHQNSKESRFETSRLDNQGDKLTQSTPLLQAAKARVQD
jgi:hypothetical protein